MLGSATGPRLFFRLSRAGGIVYLCMMIAGMNLSGAGGASGGARLPGVSPPPASDFARSMQEKAGSRSPADLQEVGRALISPRDLLRLNTAQEYATLSPETLALQKILAGLSKNPSEAARAIIGDLCSNKDFLAEQARVECLLLALPKIHPLPEKALPLLRKSVEPASENLEIAIRVLIDIGEKSTLDLFASQVLASRQDFVLVQSWMRDPLLRHRRDPAVLEMCAGLLQQPKFEAGRKNALVEALFDYRPSEWYHSEGTPPKPPSSKSLPRGSRELLKKIGIVIAADPAITTKNKALAEKSVRGM